MHVLTFPESVAWPTVPFGAWRLWANGVTWPDIEPARGVWHFDRLDRYVTLAASSHLPLLLTLGMVPSWASSAPETTCPFAPYVVPGCTAPPRDVSDWRDYVRAVAERYRGRLTEYEIWNEPNTRLFYSGTTDELVALSCAAYRELKAVDPRIVVTSPAASGGSDGVAWLDEFLAKGGGKCVDVIAFHFYVSPAPPEAMGKLIDDVRRVMGAHGIPGYPLWNTETTWMDPKPFPSESLSAAYVARAYLVAASHGLQRFYWYGWARPSMDAFPSVFLNREDGMTRTLAGEAYTELQKWLVGARLPLPCAPFGQGFWVCELGGSNRENRVIWRPDGSRTFTIPANWNARRIRDLHGAQQTVAPGASIVVGAMPVLVE